MTSMDIPKKNAAFTFNTALQSVATPTIFKTTPTLAAGDITVSKDGGNFANIGTLPTQIQTTGVLSVALTAAEMNADLVVVLFHDAAGSEWADLLVTLNTATGTISEVDTAVDNILDDTGASGVLLTAAYDAAKTAAQEATLTALKGAGWSNETLVAIDALIDAIKAKTDLLGSATVAVSSPVAASGNPTIYRGDDYNNTDGRALEWSNADGDWPDLTAATITLYVKEPDGTKSNYAGSVVTPLGAGQKIRVELTKTQSAAMAAHSRIEIQIVATLAVSAREVTLVYGTMNLKESLK